MRKSGKTEGIRGDHGDTCMLPFPLSVKVSMTRCEAVKTPTNVLPLLAIFAACAPFPQAMAERMPMSSSSRERPPKDLAFESKAVTMRESALG